jgi:hypothetical protein
MKVRPIRRRSAPGFPTRSEAIQVSDILHSIPRRWRGHVALAAILGCSVVLPGCTYNDARQTFDEAVDRVAVALHLRQPRARMMGAVGIVPHPSEHDAQRAIREGGQSGSEATE